MSANMQDPAKLFQRYLDGLIEMGIKPGPTLMIALSERAASEAKSERINDEPKPTPRSIWQKVWGWRKWALKAAMGGIWIWFSWFFWVIMWHPGLVLVGAVAAILYLASAVRDIVEGEEQG